MNIDEYNTKFVILIFCTFCVATHEYAATRPSEFKKLVTPSYITLIQVSGNKYEDLYLNFFELIEDLFDLSS